MTQRQHLLGKLLLLLLATTVTGCAPVSAGFDKVQAVLTGAAANDQMTAEAYYASAVTAINKRSYGLALIYLQAARDQKPDDVRILNAFGVVYDKLGRFDLSARYYGQALALAPRSTVVAQNMAYSRMLQGLSATAPAAGPQTAEKVNEPPAQTAQAPAMPASSAASGITTRNAATLAADAKPVTAPKTVAAAQPVAVVADAIAVAARSDIAVPKIAPSARIAPVPVAASARLAIVNASGEGKSGDIVRGGLSALHWMIARAGAASAGAQKHSLLYYPERRQVTARKLARTLPFPVQMSVTAANSGIQLVIGSDFLLWKEKHRLPSAWRQTITVAALPDSKSKGVR